MKISILQCVFHVLDLLVRLVNFHLFRGFLNLYPSLLNKGDSNKESGPQHLLRSFLCNFIDSYLTFLPVNQMATYIYHP